MEKHKFLKSNEYSIRANNTIPGGAHTYSKGRDQFPEMYPKCIVSGKGAIIKDLDGNEFVDWGMALTSSILGYANSEVNEVVARELENGINFTLPSYIENELAEDYLKQIDSAEMVKFGKNGSDVTTAAVRLARAYTGKNIILRCGDQPFFSISDWFISDTKINAGIPNTVFNYTKRFKYNDVEDFRQVVEKYADEGIACAILQPSVTEAPLDGYLESLRDICTEKGIVLIFDEVVTGGRYHAKGAQYLYGVKPDLSTFGKAMANGFSFSVLTGKKHIMELGGLNHNKERVFLLSSTYGAETHHLKAAQKVLEILNRNNYEVNQYITNIGNMLKEELNSLFKESSLENFLEMKGYGFKPYLNISGVNGVDPTLVRNVLQQEVVKQGVVFLNFAPSFAHTTREVDITVEAFKKALPMIKDSIDKNQLQGQLIGSKSRPVFRKYNSDEN